LASGRIFFALSRDAIGPCRSDSAHAHVQPKFGIRDDALSGCHRRTYVGIHSVRADRHDLDAPWVQQLRIRNQERPPELGQKTGSLAGIGNDLPPSLNFSVTMKPTTAEVASTVVWFVVSAEHGIGTGAYTGHGFPSLPAERSHFLFTLPPMTRTPNMQTLAREVRVLNSTLASNHARSMMRA